MANVPPISEAVNAGITPGERALLAELDSMGRAERAQNAELQDTRLALQAARESVCLLERQVYEKEQRAVGTCSHDCDLDACPAYLRGVDAGYSEGLGERRDPLGGGPA
jgi:hypothetical protein